MKTVLVLLALSALTMVEALPLLCSNTVCAIKNGTFQTFNCEIVAITFGYLVLYNGECGVYPNCDMPCLPKYVPVCGIKDKDSPNYVTKTFENECFRLNDACLSKPGYEFFHLGVCL